MGSVSVFELRLPLLPLACVRDFDRGYVLEVGELRMLMSTDVASMLAFAAIRIRHRAQVADAQDKEMKAGAVFRRQLSATDGRAVLIEIGITDVGGDSIYIAANDSRIRLDDMQSQYLLFALAKLGDDVAAVRGQSSQPQQLNLTRQIVNDYMRR